MSYTNFQLLNLLALWDPEEMNFDGTIIASWIILQYLNMEFVDCQRNGFVIVLDFEGFTLQQAWATKHWRIITFLRWGQVRKLS